jgi:thiol:disulfide interchange protein DsbA
MTVDPKRRRILLAVAAAPALACTAVADSSAAAYQSGTDYQTLEAVQPVVDKSKIEVVDFFQYSCPHCYHFLPELTQWKRSLGPDVHYRYLPVVFDERTAPHARILYTLEALHKTEEMHAKVFKAFHQDHRSLLDVNEIADFMAGQGIDRAQWLATFNSFTVATQARRAGEVWRGYQVEGTPSLGCDGRYLTSPEMARGTGRSLDVMNFLIAQLRAGRGHG